MKATILVLILAVSAAAQSKARPPRETRAKLTEVIVCLKFTPEGTKPTSPQVTMLDCGVDETGESLILEIPETWYQFVLGDLFRMEFYSDGWLQPAVKQPPNSIVLTSKPCPKKKIFGERRPPLQAAPCNPELVEFNEP